MTIRDLFQQAGVVADRIEGDAEVVTMTMDSRRVKSGAMFVCMPPANSGSRDSNEFVPAAVANGATSVLTFSVEGYEAALRVGLSAALLAPEQYQDALWRLAKVAFGNPSASMKVIGVTGTNGKTTTAWLIRDMLKALGVKAAYLGTLGFQLPDEERELQNTTPFSIELNELLAEARDKGVEAIAMEVSSHALAEKRVDGVEFDAAVFTNLTQDHLDFHGSMEAYKAAKWRLFLDLPWQTNKKFKAVINTLDPAGLELQKAFSLHVHAVLKEQGAVPESIYQWYEEPFASLHNWRSTFTYSTNGYGPNHGFFNPHSEEIAIDHIAFTFSVLPGTAMDFADYTAGAEVELVASVPEWDSWRFEAPLGGRYNFENLTAAAAALTAMGWSPSDVARAMPEVRPVPGRFEAVPNDAGIGILIDYAHTPDALEKLLDAVRPLTKGRVITVFGCGGDRDRTKRPKMAKAASERSDITVVTSDNPRTEDPQSILDEVLTGIVPGSDSIAIIDRREAIAHAIKIANPGDVVVIAGKGHENYQIIGKTKYPMDDRELARDALKGL